MYSIVRKTFKKGIVTQPRIKFPKVGFLGFQLCFLVWSIFFHGHEVLLLQYACLFAM